MLRNVTLLARSTGGKATWELLGPDGRPLAAFDAFARILMRGPVNTRKAYCRHLAECIDYLFDALDVLRLEGNQSLGVLRVDGGGQVLSRRGRFRVTKGMLGRALGAYHEYLVMGTHAGSDLARKVALRRPTQPCSERTSRAKHAAVRKFLSLSEELRRERAELSRQGLLEGRKEVVPLFDGLRHKSNPSPRQRNAIKAASMLAGVLAGGPSLLPRVMLGSDVDPVTSSESIRKVFPFDAIAPFIESLPLMRDRTYYSFLAASGARSHEGLQILLDDIDGLTGEVWLRAPSSRPRHPSYLALSPLERDKLTWKGRNTERTLLIEPFASMFFQYLERYLETEYVPHGEHNFLFQYRANGLAGKPYFLSAASSRQQVFKSAGRTYGLAEYIRGVHAFRHGYGTYLLNYFPRPDGTYGLPLGLVRELMGHESVKSTLVYARYDDDLVRYEREHANRMVFDGATPKSILQLKFEALNSQLAKVKIELEARGIQLDGKPLR